jgi:hypothetical protein
MHPEAVVVTVPVLEVSISPLGFHRYASEFLRTARAFPDNSGFHKSGFTPVPYYLVCRALELVLKAFALAKGDTVDAVKNKVGHDLTKALKRAKELGLDSLVSLSTEEELELTKANDYYCKKGFEYFQLLPALKGYADLPSLRVLEELATRLVTGTERECLTC